ncbi:M48 family metallopeptidase [Halomicrobium salinisoli]|uniref:M48 family metallopeptidase n=1 Tax=Halomicrobium salinisoli TaxID=2878391 RepID=UPI001CF093CC|nr:M48 family metalloprotease [Halomicrobium salinisoli]
MPSTRSLRSPLRLAALVGALVAFDAVFVVVAYWFGHVAVGASFTAADWEVAGLLADALRFETLPSVEVAAVGTLATLGVQSAFGYRKSVRTLPASDDEQSSDDAPDRDELEERIADHEAHRTRLEERVTALSHVADTAPPEVRLVDDGTPNSFVIGRPGERTLVATTALVETLDDDYLDAVLAHELAHLKNGDAFVMTAASFLPTVTRQVNDRVVDYFRTLHPRVETEEDWKSAWINYYGTITMLIAGPIALVASSALYVASGACYRLLSRIREFRADGAAVAICGSPAALAGALETLSRPQSRPSTDLRARTGVRELCILPHAIGGDGDEERDDAVARARRRCRGLIGRLLPSSHPPVERRVERLRARERDRRS